MNEKRRKVIIGGRVFNLSLKEFKLEFDDWEVVWKDSNSKEMKEMIEEMND